MCLIIFFFYRIENSFIVLQCYKLYKILFFNLFEIFNNLKLNNDISFIILILNWILIKYSNFIAGYLSMQ